MTTIDEIDTKRRTIPTKGKFYKLNSAQSWFDADDRNTLKWTVKEDLYLCVEATLKKIYDGHHELLARELWFVLLTSHGKLMRGTMAYPPLEGFTEVVLDE